MNQFEKIGLGGRVEFFISRRHPADCEEGIYESHMACIRKGLEEGARRMVVFEDDVVLRRFRPRRLEAAVRFLDTTPDWDLFFLGCLVAGSERTREPAVVKIRYQSLAHAYAINRSCAEALVLKPWRRIPFDGVMKEFGGCCFALYPSMAFQGDFSSDNLRHRGLEVFRRCLGGLRRIQRVNEIYHRHRRVILLLHLLAAGGFLSLVL
jgi:hypothetical protein